LEVNKKILLIDDQKEILDSLKKLLSGKDSLKNITNRVGDLVKDFFEAEEEKVEKEEIYEVHIAERGEKGYAMVKEANEKGEPYSVVAIDMRMPGWDGMKTATEIRNIDKNIEMLIVTAYTDRKRDEIVEAVGTPEKLLYLKKPFDREEILQVMLSLTMKWSLEKEVKKQIKLITATKNGLENVIQGINDIESLKPPVMNTIVDEIMNQLMKMFNLKNGYVKYCGKSECSVSGDENLDEEIIDKIIENVGKEGYVENENQLIIPFKDELFIIAKAVFEKESEKKFDSNEKNLLKIFIANANNIIRNASLYTELENANRELISINEELREANELNKKFLVISSHELRTPITLMSGYIQLLENKMYRGEEEKDKLYDGLKNSTQRLTKIVNNMLESFAISNRGKDIIFNKEHYNIEEIFDSVCEKIKPFKDARGISLILEKEIGLPKIFTDKVKIVDSILFNLIMNSIKSSKDGKSILIKARLLKQGNKAEISVKDEGIGISPKDLENIFSPFYVAGDEKRHHSGVYEYRSAGIGLGLTIVKNIVELMGGEIWCESEEGKGAEFIFTMDI
jgi:two-component system, NtrC family, sensor kinase